MTDDQISEAIEQHVLGYIVAGPYVADRHGHFVRMLDDPRPNYCDDAMVGWLFVYLMDLGLMPDISGRGAALGDEAVEVLVYNHPSITPPGEPRYTVEVYDTRLGRALALATLRAHGFTVEPQG